MATKNQVFLESVKESTKLTRRKANPELERRENSDFQPKPSIPQNQANRNLVLILLALATLVFALLHIFFGTSDSLSFKQVILEVLKGPTDLVDDSGNAIVWSIRMPRTVECLLVGGLLGSVGSVFQALLRNPLADPYTVGVSSGAALGGVAATVFGVSESFGHLRIAGAGCVTGVLTLFLVYRLSLRKGVVDVRTLLLAGVIIGSVFSSMLSLLLLTSGRNEANVLHWMLGDMSGAEWPRVGLQAPVLLVGFTLLYLQSKRLNAFAIGEATAQRLGVDIRRLTKIILLCGGVMTAAAVGTVGVIGFLGLVAPHISRKLVGVDWRWSLPASLGTGAVLLLSSDLIAERVFSWMTHTQGMDIPVGIVTSLIGAPSLLILLRKV